MENSTFPGKEEASNDGWHVVKGKKEKARGGLFAFCLVLLLAIVGSMYTNFGGNFTLMPI